MSVDDLQIPHLAQQAVDRVMRTYDCQAVFHLPANLGVVEIAGIKINRTKPAERAAQVWMMFETANDMNNAQRFEYITRVAELLMAEASKLGGGR